MSRGRARQRSERGRQGLGSLILSPDPCWTQAAKTWVEPPQLEQCKRLDGYPPSAIAESLLSISTTAACAAVDASMITDELGPLKLWLEAQEWTQTWTERIMSDAVHMSLPSILATTDNKEKGASGKM